MHPCLMTVYPHFSAQLDFWHPISVHYIVIGTDVDFQVRSYLVNHVQRELEQNKLQYE